MKLIVDGDLLLYRAAAASEKETQFGDVWVLWSKFEDAKGILEEMVGQLEEQAQTDHVIFAMSDTHNWRKDILATYKGNRKDTRKPVVYKALEEYARQHWEILQFPSLEADDVMGMYASRDGYAIWTMDKDLKQCVGTHLVDDDYEEITDPDGSEFHLKQALMGDTTDGYGGCPGVGEGTALEFLRDPYKLVHVGRELKSGKNKGEIRYTWQKEPTDNVWEGIVSLYAKQGLTEADALVQARVARILRDGEYDFEKEEVVLWTPKT
ncbi:hypothetical protein [Shimia sp.]|uniref:hypothetical protein n=1 Tax=Shimia sp. TaxID=1954381 RepID=UPI003BAD5F85